MDVFLSFLMAFLLTAAVEGAVMFIMYRKPIYSYYTLLCNMLTNPAMNAVLFASSIISGRDAYIPLLIICESAAVIVECSVLHYLTGLGYKKSLLTSLLLNSASYFSGLLLRLI
jgi:hypothetical protein